MKHELIKNIYIHIKDETIRPESNLNNMYNEFKNDFDKLSLYLKNKGYIEFDLIKREVYLFTSINKTRYTFTLNSLSRDFKPKIESFFKSLPDVKEDIKKFIVGCDSVFYSHIYNICKPYKNTKGFNLIYDYILNYCKNNNIKVHS